MVICAGKEVKEKEKTKPKRSFGLDFGGEVKMENSNMFADRVSIRDEYNGERCRGFSMF